MMNPNSAIHLPKKKVPKLHFILRGKYPPAQTFVLGCGVAGLSAIGTSKAMGSVVRAWDVRDVSDQAGGWGKHAYGMVVVGMLGMLRDVWSCSFVFFGGDDKVWSNYSDLTRPHPKWWFSKGNPFISGKSRLVKYYNLAR